MIALVPRSTLFPYTTLFRSEAAVLLEEGHRIGDGAHAAAVGALADEFHAVDKPLFPQRSGCGGLFEGQGSSFDRKDRKSTRLNSSHVKISYAVFCLKKKRDQ